MLVCEIVTMPKEWQIENNYWFSRSLLELSDVCFKIEKNVGIGWVGEGRRGKDKEKPPRKKHLFVFPF